jgi:hypothetical protein
VTASNVRADLRTDNEGKAPGDLPRRLSRSVKILLPALRREAGNLTQVEFAKLLGWEPGKVARLERGVQRFVVGDLMHVADTLRQDPIHVYARFVHWCRTDGWRPSEIGDRSREDQV